MSIFFCSSNCDLGKEKMRQLEIESFNVPYSFEGKKYSYSSNKKFDYDKFYEQLKNGAELLPMAVQDYVDALKPCMDAGEDVLLLHTNKKLNPSYQNLKMAILELKNKYPDREIKRVDSYSLSLGFGLIAYDVALRYKKGEKIGDIFKQVKTLRKQYATYIMLDNYKSLEKIGKAPKTERPVSAALNIKPILTLSNFGEWVNCNNAMGRKKGLAELLDKLTKMGENIADYPIGISHCNCQKDAEALADAIHKKFGEDIQIWIQPMSPDMSCLLGLGALTLSFRCKKREEAIR